MTAFGTSKFGYCGTAAAAYTSAHNSKILDTALGGSVHCHFFGNPCIVHLK